MAHIYAADAEPRHRMRVASRRLRELLPVLGLDAHTARKLSRRLKTVTRQLGAVRELDVLLLTIEELRRDDRYSPAALELVRVAVEDAEVAARGRLNAKLPPTGLHRLGRRLERAVGEHARNAKRRRERITHRSQPAWIWALDARVTRRASRLRSAIETAGIVYVPARLHDVRVALKKFRYSMELAAEVRQLRPPRGMRQLALLKRAQDLLGRLHDLEMLIEHARREQASPSPPPLIIWRDLGLLLSAVQDDCRSLHARYVQQRSRLLAIADEVAKANVDAIPVKDGVAG